MKQMSVKDEKCQEERERMMTDLRPMNSLSLASQAWQSKRDLPKCMEISMNHPWPAWTECTLNLPAKKRTDPPSIGEWS